MVLQQRRRRHPGRAPSAEEILRGHLTVAVVLWVVGFVARPILVFNEVNAATSLPISNLDFYALGIFVSVATLWERAGLKLPEPVVYVRERPWLALGGMAIGATVIALAATDPAVWTPEQDVLRYLMYTLMAGGAMIYFVLGDQRSPANTWFSDRRWGWLAVLSLHLYLWHQLMLGGFDRYVTEVAELHIGPRFTTGLAVWAGAVLATVAVSAALRPVLDWPYARWAHDATDSHDPRRRRRPKAAAGRRPPAARTKGPRPEGARPAGPRPPKGRGTRPPTSRPPGSRPRPRSDRRARARPDAPPPSFSLHQRPAGSPPARRTSPVRGGRASPCTRDPQGHPPARRTGQAPGRVAATSAAAAATAGPKRAPGSSPRRCSGPEMPMAATRAPVTSRTGALTEPTPGSRSPGWPPTPRRASRRPGSGPPIPGRAAGGRPR